MENAETDCRALLERLQQYIDGEILTPVDCASFERHLEACRHCLDRVDFERGFKLMIHQKCAEEPPAELVERLRARFRDLER